MQGVPRGVYQGVYQGGVYPAYTRVVYIRGYLPYPRVYIGCTTYPPGVHRVYYLPTRCTMGSPLIPQGVQWAHLSYPRVYIRLPVLYLRVYIRFPVLYLRVYHAGCVPCTGCTMLGGYHAGCTMHRVYLRRDTSAQTVLPP